MAEPEPGGGTGAARGRLYKPRMSRVPFAVIVGLVGLGAYIVAVVTLADRVVGAAWPIQGLYFVLAGTVWVLPARWLMLWAARLR